MRVLPGTIQLVKGKSVCDLCLFGELGSSLSIFFGQLVHNLNLTNIAKYLLCKYNHEILSKKTKLVDLYIKTC